MRNPEPTLTPTALERWESWPLWAIGLSNGLNIALWFVLSMVRVRAPELALGLPRLVDVALPWLIVAGAIAAALSLDGVLIAAIAGARHGRVGLWTWLTIVGAGVFSAAIAYAVHAGRLDDAPVLHIAQAIVLVLYNLHLSQPRKALTLATEAASGLPGQGPAERLQIIATAPKLAAHATPAAPLALPADLGAERPQQSQPKPCKYCGQLVTFAESGAHGLRYKRHGRCVAG